MAKIKEEAAKLGTSYYKFVEPFIININEKIGRGSYGQVYKGADIRNGNLVAVKTISTANIKKDTEKFYESLKNEIEIMKAIKNENIVQLYDVKKSANNIYLFQELCDKGSLEDVLEKRKKLP